MIANPTAPNPSKLMAQLRMMPDQQLLQYAQMHKNDPYIFPMAFQESNTRKQMRAAQYPQAAQAPKVVDQDLQDMAASTPAPQMAQALPEEQGIGTLPAPNIARMAGGGIIAFDEGGDVPGYAEGVFTGTSLTPYIEKYAQEYKIDPSVLSRIVNAESKGKTTAKNPESTAHGAGQLLNEMWKKMGGGDRQDAEVQVRNAAKLLRSNTDNFRNATGRNPSASEAYVTWVLGDSTGRAVLAADPTASVEDVIKKADPKLGDDIIKKNASIFKNKSVGDVTEWAANKTKLPSAVPVATATAAPVPPPVQTQGIAALTSDPATGFSMPQDVFSPSPEEERKYAAAQAQAKQNADVVNQIPGQSVKAPAYKDTNTYFGGIADRLGIPLEAQRNIANTINATSGWTAPIGGVNRAAAGIAKELEPTAEMIQKAEQAKQVATTPRILPPAKAGLEALDESSAATRAAAENARRLRQLEEDRKAAVGAEQSVDAATKSAAIADKMAKEQAALVDAARLSQAKMTGAAQGLAGMQALDKADIMPQGGVSALAPTVSPYDDIKRLQNRLPTQFAEPEKEPEGLGIKDLPKDEKTGGTDWNSLMLKMGLHLMAGKSPNALTNIGEAGLGTLAMQQAEAKSQSEAAYREAMGKHYTMPSSEIQMMEWARDPKNMQLIKQIAQAKADPKASAQEALAFLKDAGVVLRETDPVLYNALRNKALGGAVPQIQEGAGTRS